MANNIFDYMFWRGDLSFSEREFNDVDGVILARLSYLPFELIMNQNSIKEITIAEMAKKLIAYPNIENLVIQKEDIQFLNELLNSKRFNSMKLFAYVNKIDEKTQTQFSAITIKINENELYISFRGTDNTLIGWKEDFNMGFVFPVPAQELAVDYIEKIASRHSENMLVGGHSKGGNLAVYAGAFTDENSRNHIDYIYNFDGPGFSLDKIKDSGFYEIDDRIYTFVPQSSIFGMMFEHEESYTIVKSNQKGFLQHDVYSWEIEQNRLVRLKSTTNFSVFFDHTLKEFVKSLTIAQRREFTKEVFALLSLTETATFNEMLKNPLKNTGTILKSFAGLDSKTRNMLLKTIFAFVKSAKNNFSDITGGQNKITVS